MALTALVLYLVFVALAFGARTVIALRRTGDAGWRGLSGRPLSLEWWAGVLFAVAVVVGIAAPVAALAGLEPLVDAPALRWPGLVLAVGGILLTLAAQLSMGDSWRIGVDERERTDLVTAGAFRIARNPIFTAMALTAIGMTLMVPNVVSVVGLVGLTVALELQVRGVEEPYLLVAHGDRYAAYARRVGRFLPAIGRIGADGRRSHVGAGGR